VVNDGDDHLDRSTWFGANETESCTDSGFRCAPVSRRVGGTDYAHIALQNLTKFASSFTEYKSYAITLLYIKIMHDQVA
jgi:hypothetical protein